MPINRNELKLQSRILMTRSVPRPTFVAMLVSALMLVVSLLSSRMMISGISTAEAQKYMQYMMNGYYEGAFRLLRDNVPGPGAQFINFLLNAALEVVSVGFIIFLINTVRHTGAVAENILDGFGMIGRIIILEVLTSLFIALWSCLLIVPGIIASYRYRMAIYLLIDHPEMTPMQCIRESKRMMAGRKWELFMLDLSFIGWTLLETINFAGYFVMIYTLPYKGLTYVLYYEALCRQTNMNPNYYNAQEAHWTE